MSWLKRLFGKIRMGCTSSCCRAKCDVAIEPQVEQHRSATESPIDYI